MAATPRRKGRSTTTHQGTNTPGGAVVPHDRGPLSGGSTGGRSAQQPPAPEVVHVLPAEVLDDIDTEGMSVPIGAGDRRSRVRLPGETVLTGPDGDATPTPEELDRRDAMKSGPRKRTGPQAPDDDGPQTALPSRTPPEAAPPPTDPFTDDQPFGDEAAGGDHDRGGR